METKIIMKQVLYYALGFMVTGTTHQIIDCSNPPCAGCCDGSAVFRKSQSRSKREITCWLLDAPHAHSATRRLKSDGASAAAKQLPSGCAFGKTQNLTRNCQVRVQTIFCVTSVGFHSPRDPSICLTVSESFTALHREWSVRITSSNLWIIYQ